VRLYSIHHKKRCSHVFIDSQTHVPSQGTEFVMNFAIEMRREWNPRGSKLRSHTVSDLNHSKPCKYDWYQMFPSHVMRTFSTNRIYTVARVVKVRDRMRPDLSPAWTCDGNIWNQSYLHGFRVVKVRDRMRQELVPAWVRFPPYLKCKIHQEACVFHDSNTIL